MSNQQTSILRAKNQSKIEREEQELQELMKQQRGGQEPEQEVDDQVEATQEDVEETEDQVEETAQEEAEAKEPESAEEKTFKKRYGDLRRHSQKKEAELQKQIEELRAKVEEVAGAPAPEQSAMQYPTSEEELEDWMSKYPDIARIVETIAMKKAGEQTQDFESKFAEIEEMRATAAREKAEAELLKLHPDLFDINASDDFHDWIEEQPKLIQDALYDNVTDVKAASRAIDLYKADKGIKKTGKKSTTKEAAKSVGAKGSRSTIDADGSNSKIRESDVYKMNAQQYEKNHEKILEAQRTGNFIYDMSGSAR